MAVNQRRGVRNPFASRDTGRGLTYGGGPRTGGALPTHYGGNGGFRYATGGHGHHRIRNMCFLLLFGGVAFYYFFLGNTPEPSTPLSNLRMEREDVLRLSQRSERLGLGEGVDNVKDPSASEEEQPLHNDDKVRKQQPPSTDDHKKHTMDQNHGSRSNNGPLVDNNKAKSRSTVKGGDEYLKPLGNTVKSVGGGNNSKQDPDKEPKLGVPSKKSTIKGDNKKSTSMDDKDQDIKKSKMASPEILSKTTKKVSKTKSEGEMPELPASESKKKSKVKGETSNKSMGEEANNKSKTATKSEETIKGDINKSNRQGLPPGMEENEEAATADDKTTKTNQLESSNTTSTTMNTTKDGAADNVPNHNVPPESMEQEDPLVGQVLATAAANNMTSTLDPVATTTNKTSTDSTPSKVTDEKTSTKQQNGTVLLSSDAVTNQNETEPWKEEAVDANFQPIKGASEAEIEEAAEELKNSKEEAVDANFQPIKGASEAEIEEAAEELKNAKKGSRSIKDDIEGKMEMEVEGMEPLHNTKEDVDSNEDVAAAGAATSKKEQGKKNSKEGATEESPMDKNAPPKESPVTSKDNNTQKGGVSKKAASKAEGKEGAQSKFKKSKSTAAEEKREML